MISLIKEYFEADKSSDTKFVHSLSMKNTDIVASEMKIVIFYSKSNDLSFIEQFKHNN